MRSLLILAPRAAFTSSQAAASFSSSSNTNSNLAPTGQKAIQSHIQAWLHKEQKKKNKKKKALEVRIFKCLAFLLEESIHLSPNKILQLQNKTYFT